MSLIAFEKIAKQFPGREVLKEVSFAVASKERVALVGTNGTGKTTLLKIAMGDLNQDSGRVMTARGIKIGYISQSMEQFKSSNLEDTALSIQQITNLEKKMRLLEKAMKGAKDQELEELYNQYSKVTQQFEAIDGYTKEVELKKILMGLNLDENSINLPVNKLSGGEKMRVLLGRMLIENPDLLILDEPTNHLDMVAIEWLEEYLKKFSGGVLFVSHDRYFLDKVSTRIVELEGGTITECKGSFSNFIEQKNVMREFHSSEIKRLKSEIKKELSAAETLRSHRKMNAYHSRLKVVSKLEKKLDLERSKSTDMHLKMDVGFAVKTDKNNHISKLIAWGEHFHKAFGDKVLFEEAEFVIYGGEKVAVIGANGSGKTTLLNILMGLDNEFKGTATLGTWVKYGYLSQDISFEDEEVTMLDFIMTKTGYDKAQALKFLAEYKFYGDETNKKISILSGGEKMRLALAQELLKHPYCLILDEPTNHLDIYSKEVMEKLLKEYIGTVIMVSHDRYFINRSADKIIEIENRKTMMYEGNFEDYLRQKNKKDEKVDVTPEVMKASSKIDKSEMRKRKIEEEIMQLEKEILLIEEEIKKMEELFISDVKYVEYEEYDLKVKLLQKNYAVWESLSKSLTDNV
ncbi:MAG: ABC-F family ATP-binding cassette domain-containing protein [Clostridia bacterium]|nr:ABC-F family ATP-binding cassette domain-containing protein [Clostridia bacterium]